MKIDKSLCINLTTKGRNKIVIERTLKFKSQTNASFVTGVPQVNISKWESGSASPTYDSLILYLNKLGLKKEFITNKEYIQGLKYRGFKTKKIKTGKLSKEKAYVLGVVGPGDGYIGGKYSIGLNAIDQDFVDYFASCLEKTYGLKCSRYIKIPKKDNHKKQFVAILCSKSAVDDLNKYKVSFKELKWKVPQIIKNSSEDHKKMYLKGIFDSQAHVSHTFIAMKIKNKEGQKEIKKLLEDLEIESSIHNDGYKLQISGQINFKIYKNKVDFTINRKKESLKKILNAYKFNHPTRIKVKRLIPNMVQLKEQGLSNRKIAKFIGIGRGAVNRNLAKLGY